MARRSWSVVALTLAVSAGPAVAADRAREEVEGYAEWWKGDVLIVEGQRVAFGPSTRFKGSGDARNIAGIPLGYEVKAKGVRRPDGVLAADEVEAKPNNPDASFEKESRQQAQANEESIRKLGRIKAASNNPEDDTQILTEGPEVERVRMIVERLAPPYVHGSEFRVYVARDPSWNAFATANGMVVVNTGLLDEMDDDEVAIVLGHELAHVTHEHIRRERKRAAWIGVIGAIAGAAASEIKTEDVRTAAQAASWLATLAASNKFSRGLEDQADRVGLRYAYEAGYEVSKGPRLWRRFSARYGDGSKLQNFFVGSHSLSSARTKNLQREVSVNYRDAAARMAGQWDPDPAPLLTTTTAAAQAQGTKALAASAFGVSTGPALAPDQGLFGPGPVTRIGLEEVVGEWAATVTRGEGASRTSYPVHLELTPGQEGQVRGLLTAEAQAGDDRVKLRQKLVGHVRGDSVHLQGVEKLLQVAATGAGSALRPDFLSLRLADEKLAGKTGNNVDGYVEIVLERASPLGTPAPPVSVASAAAPEAPAAAAAPARAAAVPPQAASSASGAPATALRAPAATPKPEVTSRAAASAAVAPPTAPAAPPAVPPPAPRPTTVSVGMTPSQVKGILGAPQAEIGSAPNMTWLYKGKTVIFAAGKVKEIR